MPASTPSELWLTARSPASSNGSDSDFSCSATASRTEVGPIRARRWADCFIVAFVGTVLFSCSRLVMRASPGNSTSGNTEGFLSRREGNAISLSDVAGEAAQHDCYTARPGDACYQAVYWAMQEGIYTNPEWYPGLEHNSTFEDFQKSLLGRWGCRMPCAAAHGHCRTASLGEKCYEHVMWSMTEGIYSHPSWFTSLSPKSSFEEFQDFLSQEPENECGTPCVESCYTARPGESCYDAVFWAMHEGINSYPEWYPGLSSNSTFEEFQQAMHDAGSRGNCQKPCYKTDATLAPTPLPLAMTPAPTWLPPSVDPRPSPASEEGVCHTAKPGERCHQVVFWAMQQGIYSNPEWYPTLTSSSSFEEFQQALHDAFPKCETPCTGECPAPCASEVKPSQTLAPTSAPTADKSTICHDAIPGEICYNKVRWIMNEGVHAHSDWYEGIDKSSSFLEVQEFLGKDPNSECQRPCKLNYIVSSDVSYRSAKKRIIKGIAYGPSPEMKRGELLPNDDFTSEQAAPMWASWGRGDLKTIRELGANTIRLYGNDPRVDKRAFLDEALRQGLDVIVGMSDYPYLQAEDSCAKHDFDCFSQIYESYKQNLLNGLTINHNTAYHPAVKAVIIINEPELKMKHQTGDCKAVVSAFDAMLQAERDLGVVKNPIAFTVAYSVAEKYGPGAIGQMEHLYECMMRPQHGAQYSPKNDVTTAYLSRWMNTYNTPQAAGPQFRLFNQYARSSMWKKGQIPLTIGEYHAPSSNQMYDLPAMLNAATDKRNPFFLGFAFFEFQARYDKTGGFGAAYEMRFGMYGLDDTCTMAQMDFFGSTYPVHPIVPRGDMEKAVTKTFGGHGPQHGTCLPTDHSRSHDGVKMLNFVQSA